MKLLIKIENILNLIENKLNLSKIGYLLIALLIIIFIPNLIMENTKIGSIEYWVYWIITAIFIAIFITFAITKDKK